MSKIRLRNLNVRKREFASLFSLVAVVLSFFLLQVFCSCDHRDYWFDNDLPPVISVSRDGRSFSCGGFLTDSVKVGSPVHYRYSCTDTHIYEPEVFFDVSESSFEYEITDDELIFNVRRECVASGSIVGRDIYGKIVSVGFSVTAFNNRPPVARCAVTKVSNLGQYEVLIDMAESFDGDAEFGGKLVMYEYTVISSDGNVYNVQTELPAISYIFRTGGLEKVQCRVCDSDGVWSDWVSEYIDL